MYVYEYTGTIITLFLILVSIWLVRYMMYPWLSCLWIFLIFLYIIVVPC